MIRYILALAGLLIVIAFALLQMLTQAWLTATPLHPDKMHAAQFWAVVFTTIFVVATVLAVLVTIRIVRFRRSTHIS